MDNHAVGTLPITHIGFEKSTIITFSLTVIICLVVDLYCHRKDQEMTFKASCLWSVFWIVISLCFATFLWIHFNLDVASLFISGYILEKSLSVDNLFVMMAIFAWFKIPNQYRHRILYYGIIGAIVFRAVFVSVGSSLLYIGENSKNSSIIQSFTESINSGLNLNISAALLGKLIEFFVYLLFAFCVFYSAIQMLKSEEDDGEIEDYSNHKAYRLCKWLFPVWPKLHSHNFFISKSDVDNELNKQENKSIQIKRWGLFFATPLLLCLFVIEISDVMFSFDSVPAVIAVSKEPLIIYSAMIFAILGLRSMYFVLEALKKYMCHLEKAVIILLFFIAFKLCYNSICEIFELGYAIGNVTSLVVIITILSLGIIASIIYPEDSENK